MQTRECYDANNEVYKIGQSKNIIENCDNIDNIEKKLNYFITKYK